MNDGEPAAGRMCQSPAAERCDQGRHHSEGNCSPKIVMMLVRAVVENQLCLGGRNNQLQLGSKNHADDDC